MNATQKVRKSISNSVEIFRYKHLLGEHDQRTHGHRGNAVADETINFFVSKFNGREDTGVVINVAVLDNNDKVDTKKSFTVHTTAKNIEKILRERMGELADNGVRDMYTVQEERRTQAGISFMGERFERSVQGHLLTGGSAPAPAPRPKPRPSGEGVVDVRPIKFDEPILLGDVKPKDRRVADKILAMDKKFEKYRKRPNAKVTTTITTEEDRKLRIRSNARQAALIQARQEFILRYIGMGLAITNKGRKSLIKKFGKLAAFILGKNKKPKPRYRRY